MNKETLSTVEDVKLENELNDIVGEERQKVRREKFDLSSTRVVLDKLQKEGLVGPKDTLEYVKMVVEQEYKRLEDI